MQQLFQIDVFKVEKMCSGRMSLNLTSKVMWEEFPTYVEEILSVIQGGVIKKVDSFDVRLWDFEIKGVVLRIVYDDFPVMVSIESTSDAGDEVVFKIKNLLEKKRCS